MPLGLEPLKTSAPAVLRAFSTDTFLQKPYCAAATRGRLYIAPSPRRYIACTKLEQSRPGGGSALSTPSWVPPYFWV
jgi:hypothetical protein